MARRATKSDEDANCLSNKINNLQRVFRGALSKADTFIKTPGFLCFLTFPASHDLEAQLPEFSHGLVRQCQSHRRGAHLDRCVPPPTIIECKVFRWNPS
jgi:hypothetical protein